MSIDNDINVSSIDEDIKILKELMEDVELTFAGWVDILNEREKKALKNLLQDYARQKQINEEHQKENSLLRKKVKELEEENKKSKVRFEERDDELWERVKQCKNMQTEIDRLYTDKEELQQVYLHEKLAKEEIEEILEESIPKQKIKEMLEESQTLYEKKLKEIDFKELKSISLNIFEGIKLEVERGLLRRLLQESEDK